MIISRNKKIFSPLLHYLCPIFKILLITPNILAGRLIKICSKELPGGMLVFPFTFILGDTILEVYGFKHMSKLIVSSFILSLMFVVISTIVVFLPYPNFFNDVDAYKTVLFLAPGILLVSLIGFLCGSIIDSLLVAQFKKMSVFKKSLFFRAIIYTFVGGAIDVTLFILIVFVGSLTVNAILTIIGLQCLFKVGYEIILYPFLKITVNKIKSYKERYSRLIVEQNDETIRA